MLALGGSGGSSIAARAMQALPVGVPKLHGLDAWRPATRGRYVGASDVTMMYSVVDIAGVNSRLGADPGERGRRDRGHGRGAAPPTLDDASRWSPRRCSA